jgi:hypothetical protein
MSLFDLERILSVEDDDCSNGFLESCFGAHERSDDECAIAESPDVSETCQELVAGDKWVYNRKQALNRFLSGRKLSAGTKEKYGLTDNLLTMMRPFVDCKKKFKYDRNAHIRRRRCGVKPCKRSTTYQMRRKKIKSTMRRRRSSNSPCFFSKKDVRRDRDVQSNGILGFRHVREGIAREGEASARSVERHRFGLGVHRGNESRFFFLTLRIYEKTERGNGRRGARFFKAHLFN